MLKNNSGYNFINLQYALIVILFSLVLAIFPPFLFLVAYFTPFFAKYFAEIYYSPYRYLLTEWSDKMYLEIFFPCSMKKIFKPFLLNLFLLFLMCKKELLTTLLASRTQFLNVPIKKKIINMLIHELLERKLLKPPRITIFFCGVNKANSISVTC